MLRYSDLIEKLPTRAFLAPLKEDEEVEIELSKVCAECCVCVMSAALNWSPHMVVSFLVLDVTKLILCLLPPDMCRASYFAITATLPFTYLQKKGVSTHIKLKAAGELQDSGKREVYFEANGVPRVVEVVDKKSLEVLGKAAIREKVRGQKVAVLWCQRHSHSTSLFQREAKGVVGSAHGDEGAVSCLQMCVGARQAEADTRLTMCWHVCANVSATVPPAGGCCCAGQRGCSHGWHSH